MPEPSFSLGRHEALIGALDSRMDRLETTVNKIDKNVTTLLLAKAEVVGGWKVAAVVSSAAGAMMGLLATLFVKWLSH
jgi:hypothetical protein